MNLYQCTINALCKNTFRALLTVMLIALALPFISAANAQDNSTVKKSMVIYKSPSCGCCAAWVDHMKHANFNTKIQHPNSMNAIKKELGIASVYQACHTAVYNGYVFEGHIPAAVVQHFLTDKPDALGLAVPGMPMGSPGMDTDGYFSPYQVLLLNKDGTSKPYAKVSVGTISYLQKI
ncbi:MAG: hypothetical protein ACI9ES_001561 [Oceanospirillaceae bacterium]|jgi:hypothetical protein